MRDTPVDPIPVEDLDQIDTSDTAKQVADAWLTLRPSFGAAPTKQVLTVETRDDVGYMYQRFGDDEPFVRYLRDPPEGQAEPLHGGLVPKNVERVVKAVQTGEIGPGDDALAEAEAELEGPAGGVSVAVTDGGDPEEET